ncbi:MAG: Stp1/IreP family PP2C-type Ser/Thr phosphatase [Lachnospiraceae bacterium]|nr:Stp1/IreP family PP2C-type Ser/Thr phosphatase [Lachnospiraceae bacterium]
MKAFSISDIGRKRQLNQDYVYVSETPVGKLPNLFIVADGMGGHNAGDYASKITVETILNEVSFGEAENPEQLLNDAITRANELVVAVAARATDLAGMGTTVVAATCKDRVLEVANVGDSRLYVVHEEGGIEQITRDHSLVEEMVRLGGIARDDARNHPDKNIITRAVGGNATVEVDFFTVELLESDTVLMCSDGLTNMLEDEEIYSILKCERSIREKAQELVDKANEKGGKDNISVILIAPFATDNQ